MNGINFVLPIFRSLSSPNDRAIETHFRKGDKQITIDVISQLGA